MYHAELAVSLAHTYFIDLGDHILELFAAGIDGEHLNLSILLTYYTVGSFSCSYLIMVRSAADTKIYDIYDSRINISNRLKAVY